MEKRFHYMALLGAPTYVRALRIKRDTALLVELRPGCRLETRRSRLAAPRAGSGCSEVYDGLQTEDVVVLAVGLVTVIVERRSGGMVVTILKPQCGIGSHPIGRRQ